MVVEKAQHTAMCILQEVERDVVHDRRTVELAQAVLVMAESQKELQELVEEQE